jgi:hypothetical protein
MEILPSPFQRLSFDFDLQVLQLRLQRSFHVVVINLAGPSSSTWDSQIERISRVLLFDFEWSKIRVPSF